MTELGALAQKIDDLDQRLMRSNPPVLMTTEECAQFLRISRERLFQWRKEGIGPKFCAPTSRTIRYHVDDIVQWMREGGE